MISRNSLRPPVALMLLLAWIVNTPVEARAQPPEEPVNFGRARAVLVEEARNEHPSFYVRVNVDHPDHTYRVGEEMRIHVQTERDGFLYLLYLDAQRNYSCLFPNRVQQDNRIQAGPPGVTIPHPRGEFRLRISPPIGQEVLKAIVTRKPLKELQLKALTKGDFTVLTPEQIKAVTVEVKADEGDWAEHSIDILTVPAEGPAAAPPRPAALTQGPPLGPPPPDAAAPRRVGLFIGISQFTDPSIRSLKVSHRDAQAMAAAMREQGGFQDVSVLINEQATLENIQERIRNWLPQVTRPGDLVMIYWSGHGGRSADQDGDEKDGYDEYLVPSDGRLDNIDTIRRTMLLDDTFGRWIQDLDGRRLVVVLDTCYSGGQSSQAKGLANAAANPAAPNANFDFLDGDLERTKDLGQKEMAILTSSTANQVSFERKEGDLSAMTFFFIAQLRHGRGQISLPEMWEGLKGKVAAYVEQNFPGSTQTPVLIDYTTPPLYLRP
ncbi:MAG: DUF4384 domain-containing protein [Thermoguttaceae bacterium]